MNADRQRDVTVIIKAFKRPEAVRTLVDSIRRFYPAIGIVVADDSRHPAPPDGIDEFIPLPYDVGVSAGRNAMVDRVQTPYLVLTDDDNEFTDDTRLDRMWNVLDSTDFNLVSGRRRDLWRGVFEVRDRNLILQMNRYRELSHGLPVFEYGHNFFMARTEIIRTLRWADRLKTYEHTEFFYRGRNILKSTEVDVRFLHHHARSNPGYVRKRFRQRFQRMALEMHGFRDVCRLKHSELGPYVPGEPGEDSAARPLEPAPRGRLRAWLGRMLGRG